MKLADFCHLWGGLRSLLGLVDLYVCWSCFLLSNTKFQVRSEFVICKTDVMMVSVMVSQFKIESVAVNCLFSCLLLGPESPHV